MFYNAGANRGPTATAATAAAAAVAAVASVAAFQRFRVVLLVSSLSPVASRVSVSPLGGVEEPRPYRVPQRGADALLLARDDVIRDVASVCGRRRYRR